MVALAELHAQTDLKELEFTLKEKDVVFKLKISQINTFINWIELYGPFKRREVSNSISGKDGVELARKRYVMDSYYCEYTGENKAKLENSKMCDCESKVDIVYPQGYEHKSNGEINFKEFGDFMAKITWTWQHNHPMESISRFYNSELVKDMKNGLCFSVTNGISWDAIAASIRAEGSNLDLGKKLNRNVLAYIYAFPVRKRILMDSAIRDACLETSLKAWANEINKVGIAIYENGSNLSEDYPMEDTESDQKKPWSFAFMTKWQKEMFLRDGGLCYLECTDFPCQTSQKEEKVYLFTILVGSRSSCRGCPIAFMATNSNTEDVITSFLKLVKDFSGAKPFQAMIDLGVEQANALKNVWPEMEVTTCRWFITRSFREHVAKEEVALEERRKMYGIERAQTEFLRVLPVSIGSEVETGMRHDFREYEKGAILSQASQLGDALDLVNDMDDTTSHHDLIVSFHTTLKLRFFNSFVGERLDVLIFNLFKRIEPMYHIEEILENKGVIPRENPLQEVTEKINAFELSDDDVLKNVLSYGVSSFSVPSFSVPNERYTVLLVENTKSQEACSCPLWIETQISCKHIISVLRWRGLIANYFTWDKS